MIYRIKQISKNEFIPQCGSFSDWIFGTMEGIDKDLKHTWFNSLYQKQYCVVNSLEEAKEIIKKYKGEKGYPKYHKP